MSQAASSRRVLVVDDNVDAAYLLEQILTIKGFDVRVAFDAFAGMTEATSFEPQVVITDVVMPGKSGFDLARDLRSSEFGAKALIVAVSGYAGEYFHSRRDTADIDIFLTKPVAYTEICMLLDSHFDQIALSSEPINE